MAISAQSAVFRGFSTAKSLATRGKTFSTADFETVKQDLLNEIFTIPGERVMYPEFGTRIPLLAFEPISPETIKIIEDDLTKVFNNESRVSLVEIAVLPLTDNNAIVVLVDLIYLQLNTTETLKLTFKVNGS